MPLDGNPAVLPAIRNSKVKHWHAFQAIFAPEGAPVLEFIAPMFTLPPVAVAIPPLRINQAEPDMRAGKRSMWQHNPGASRSGSGPTGMPGHPQHVEANG